MIISLINSVLIYFAGDRVLNFSLYSTLTTSTSFLFQKWEISQKLSKFNRESLRILQKFRENPKLKTKKRQLSWRTQHRHFECAEKVLQYEVDF